MTARELVPIALRVLSGCIKGCKPDPRDAEILRQHASPGEADLDIDVLACAIVRRETARELAASRSVRNSAKPHGRGGRKKIA